MLAAGHRVIGYDVTRTGDDFGEGFSWANSPAEVASQCQTVISVLPNDAVLKLACDGPGGILEGFRQGAIHNEAGAAEPVSAGRFGMKVSQKGNSLDGTSTGPRLRLHGRPAVFS